MQATLNTNYMYYSIRKKDVHCKYFSHRFHSCSGHIPHILRSNRHQNKVFRNLQQNKAKFCHLEFVERKLIFFLTTSTCIRNSFYEFEKYSKKVHKYWTSQSSMQNQKYWFWLELQEKTSSSCQKELMNNSTIKMKKRNCAQTPISYANQNHLSHYQPEHLLHKSVGKF